MRRAAIQEAVLYDCVGRAYGLAVNEARLLALRTGRTSIEVAVPVTDLVETAERMIAGQYPGRRPRVEPGAVRTTILREAKGWRGVLDVVDGVDVVRMQVEVPPREGTHT